MKQVLFILNLILSINVYAQQQITVTCPECGHKIEFSIDNTTIVQKDSTEITEVSKQCKAITAKGIRCSRKAQKDSEYCWQHLKAKSTAITNKKTTAAGDNRCRAITKSGSRCKRAAKSNGYCWQHGG